MTALPKATPDVVFCEVEDGAVLLHAVRELYFGLNRVGSEIWQLLPPVHARTDELLASLQARYPEVAPDVLAADVEALLADLLANGLVEPPA